MSVKRRGCYQPDSVLAFEVPNGVAKSSSEIKLSLSKVPILDRSERLEDEDP
jgi:peptidoglycan biosynthesis protein MviN/MurJ (putative lipid II flippase)